MRRIFVTAIVATQFVAVVTTQNGVSYDRIRAAASEPSNWLTFSGNYQGHRHSPLTEMTAANVSRLKTAWVYQMRDPGKVSTSPIVVDGTVYITEKPHIVTALDGRTGRPLWTYRGDNSAPVRGCCGPASRGLAILDDAVFFTTFDARLIALDRHTGTVRWESVMADYQLGYSSTGAPLTVRDKVIVGVAGGDYGVRGFLDAYDARTGRQLWRRWTVPAPGEFGNDTWAGESWKTGGAATWVTGSYDPQLNLLYWGTGNPGPDWNGDDRAGDNLYSNSLLAIDADTGALRWHFQFTPHDVHDRDANQVPVLVDRVVNGRMRKLVVTANRNGFYYVLDRETGEFLSGTAYVKQDWAVGLDPRGRPITKPESVPTTDGTLVYPGAGGGTNWTSPSFSPLTSFFYLSAYDDYRDRFFKRPATYRPGRSFEGGYTASVPGDEPEGAIKALDAFTGNLEWEFKLQSLSYSGVLSTAGGLLFGGTAEGDFFALDARTGKPLWNFQTGGEIAANPIGFAVNNKQHIAIAAGAALFAFALD